MNDQELEQLQAQLGIKLQDTRWLVQAMELNRLALPPAGLYSHETLEFMGDGVLGLSLRRLLIMRLGGNEGLVTQVLELVASNRYLAHVSEELGLPAYASLPPEVAAAFHSGGPEQRWRQSADLLEAVIGALFLDGGDDYDGTAAFVQRVVWPRLEVQLPDVIPLKPRALLFNRVRQRFGQAPRYVVTGPEAGSSQPRLHKAQVYVNDRLLGAGQGASSWLAETAAARSALRQAFGLTEAEIKQGGGSQS